MFHDAIDIARHWYFVLKSIARYYYKLLSIVYVEDPIFSFFELSDRVSDLR